MFLSGLAKISYQTGDVFTESAPGFVEAEKTFKAFAV